jgi:hypothetical protein
LRYRDRYGPVHGYRDRPYYGNRDRLRHGYRDRARDRNCVWNRDRHWDGSVDSDWYGVRDRDWNLFCYGVHLHLAPRNATKTGTVPETGATETSITQTVS